MDTPQYAHLKGDAKKALRSRLRGQVRLEMAGNRERQDTQPAPERRPRSQSARRKAQEDAALLTSWAEAEDIPVPENEEDEAWQLRQATEDSRATLRRRVEEEDAPEGAGGASSSRAGAFRPELPRAPESEEVSSRRRPQEEEQDRPEKRDPGREGGEVIRRLRERTSRLRDAVIENLWERYDNSREAREAAFKKEEFRTSALLHQDMDEYVQRMEVRERDLQHEHLRRQYPQESKGKGKGKGKFSKGPEKRPRTGGASGW